MMSAYPGRRKKSHFYVDNSRMLLTITSEYATLKELPRQKSLNSSKLNNYQHQFKATVDNIFKSLIIQRLY